MGLRNTGPVVGSGLTVKLNVLLLEIHPFPLVTVILNWYVLADTPVLGMLIPNGVLPKPAFETDTKPGIAGAPVVMLYVVGEAEMAVYGKLKVLTPSQTDAIDPNVMVGFGFTVTVTFWVLLHPLAAIV